MHFRRHRTCCTKDTKGYGLNKAPWIWPRKWPPKHTKDYSASDSMRPNGTSDCTEVDTVNLGRIGRPYGTLDIARCRNQHPRVLNSYSSPLDEAINQRTIATLVTIFTFDNQLCQIVRERGPIHDNHIYQIYRGRNFAGQVSDGRPEAFQHQVMSSILFLPGYQTIFCPTTHVIVFGMSMKPPDAGSPQQHVKVPVSVSMAEPSSG
ncbi:hypothetical protein pipiens_019121 [Culex pipiens pipiens]|uniref:Uncharacterized protein n=1 Tax=Culex pipiens pipiens TaxID=38569 RepID=A0ABD1DW56_CULPP